MPGFDYSLRSVLARDYCSGTAASISHSNHYPYDRPAAGKKASQANSASSGQATFSQNSRPQLSGFMRTLNTVIEHLKHMKGAQQLWEVRRCGHAKLCQVAAAAAMQLQRSMRSSVQPPTQQHCRPGCREEEWHDNKPCIAGRCAGELVAMPCAHRIRVRLIISCSTSSCICWAMNPPCMPYTSPRCMLRMSVDVVVELFIDH